MKSNAERSTKTSLTGIVKPLQKLRWWQVRTSDFALFLYPIIFQKILMLPIWIVGKLQADQENLPLSYVLDVPMAGNHPSKMLSVILILIWIYFATCLFSALNERSYPWPKLAMIFILIFGILSLTTYNFNALFEFSLT